MNPNGVLFHCVNAFQEGNCKSVVCNGCLLQLTSAYDKKNSTSVIRVGDGLKKRSSARSAVQRSRFTRGHNPTSTGTKDNKSKNGTQSQLCIHCRDEDEAGDDEYSLFDRERVLQNLKEIDPSTLSWPSKTIDLDRTTLCVSWYKKS